MRIAFVTTEYITESDSFDGGLSNYLHKVSLNLVAAGHEPVIIELIFQKTISIYYHQLFHVFHLKGQNLI